MSYTPTIETAELLGRAMRHVQSVPYTVTARWLFYRLLQEGSLPDKAAYKRLLGYLSKARKEEYGGWHPETLADDTRSALVRGGGFTDGNAWLRGVARQECYLDHWAGQENYVECWFEAAAMTGQFEHYTDPNISLLSFKGDVSIPAKMASARRLYRRMEEGQNVVVLYYGDLDPKGLQIPESARKDVELFIARLWARAHFEEYPGSREPGSEWHDDLMDFLDRFTFERVGLSPDQVQQYGVLENPERPGSYQWEGLDDGGAEELIQLANDYVDQGHLAEVQAQEDDITRRFRQHLNGLDLNGTD